MSRQQPAPSQTHQHRELKLEVFEQVRAEIRKMHSALDLGPLLWVLCNGLNRLGLRFDFFGINLIDAQAMPPAATVHFRTPAGGWGQHRYPSIEGLPLLAIWKQQKLVYRRDLQADDPYGELARFTTRRRSVVDIPFSHGTLALSSAAPDAFAPGDLELLQEMAALCSEGFSRLDELQALERRAQEAEVLSAAIAVVAGASGLEEVFQVVVREAERLTYAEWVTLFLWDELEQALVPRAFVGHRDEVYLRIRLQSGEDISGQVLRSGEAVLCDDHSPAHQTLRPENRALMATSMRASGGTGAVVPLRLGGRVLGTLSVYSTRHRCTQRDLILLERLAAQAALAIDRARHDRELSLNLALQRVRNETLRMDQVADWNRVSIAFQEELRGLVDYCRCSIQLIDLVRGQFVCYGSMHLDPEGKPSTPSLELRAGLRWVVENGAPLYRRTRAEIESWGEVEIGPQINSVVDVPFLGGTLAMNSTRDNGFTQQDIQTLEHFAHAMSEAYQRLEELQRQEAVRQVRDAIWEMRRPADLEQVLTVIRDQLIANQFSFDDLGVGVVEEQSAGLLVRHYNYQRSEDGGRWVIWTDDPALDSHPIYRFWREGKVMYRRDLQAEDPFQEAATFPSYIRSVLDVPFSHGTLAITSKIPVAFSAADIALLEELAVVLSEGFKRIDDLQRLEQRAQEAEALASAINAVYSYADLEHRLQEIVRQVRELIGAQRCMLLLYDEASGVLVPRAQEGYGEMVLQMRIAPGEGLTGYVYTTGKAYFNQSLPNPQLKPLILQNQALLQQAITGSALGPSAGIPLKLGGQTIGAVVAGRVGRVLGERDLLLLERMAAQASLAIERSRHNQELALNLALQRVRNEILEMQEERDWQKVLFSLHRELGNLVEFWFCSFQFIDQQTDGYTYYTTDHSQETGYLQSHKQLPLTPSLRQVLATGRPLYRRTRKEVERFDDEVGPEVECIIDAPFMGGTVAINSTRENAFSDRDIAVLERFAQVISEGYRRLQDLQDLAQTRKRLQQAQKLEAVGQLTAGIAHNFNNLLQANLGNINLAMLNSSAEVQGFLQDADAAAMRGAELVRQLMLFARAEVKETPFRTVDLGAVIADTVSLCRKTIDRRIELEVDLPAELPLVQADPGQLEQVLLNLYLNARDALEAVPRPTPRISTAARAVFQVGPGQDQGRNYVCVEVSDNGTGMDAQTRERIFEPFFTTKEVGKGTGLGLATAYGILQRHRGWIECQSEPGAGTTFSLFLPAGEGPEGQDGAVRTGKALLPTGSETLLVVDDEELVRRSTSRLFTDLGYQVLEAADGRGCLELFAQRDGQVDLVVLDLSMPGLSGREVLRRLKAQRPQLKVIVFSGYAAKPAELAGLAAQIVEKPFSLRLLAEVVRRTLDEG